MPIFNMQDVLISSISTGGSSDGERGKPSFDITVSIDADRTDGLSGLTLVFKDVSSPGSVVSLFGPAKIGKQGANSPGAEDKATLAMLLEKTEMIEGAFVFTAQRDGTVAVEGCYFCDDDRDGILDTNANGALIRKCDSFTTSLDPSDNTPASDETLIDALLFALDGGADLVVA